MKKTIILIALISIISLAIASADSYELYCIGNGEQINLGQLCNPLMGIRNGNIMICMHLLDNGKICPAALNTCNNLGKTCSNDAHTTVDTQPPNLTITQPINHEIYNKKSIRFSFTADEIIDLYYIDNNEPNSKWKRICSKCRTYDKSRSFKEGFNNLTMKAIDKNGNEAFSNIEFIIDSKPPRITKIEPGRGFATGTFLIEFQESNPTELVLEYGNQISGMKSSELDLMECTQIRGGKESCYIEINLNDYDGELIQYSFTLTDKGENTQKSRITALTVDTKSPEINNIIITEKANNKFDISIEIDEANLERISYTDDYDLSGIEKTLCTTLKNGICKKTITLKGTGEHILNFKATDKAANVVVESKTLMVA